MVKIIVLLMFLTGLLANCSTFKPYPNHFGKNVHIWEKTDTGSILTTMEVAVDILSVSPRCETAYEGTVFLENGPVDIGIPVNRYSYLIFSYDTSSFLGPALGKVVHGTILKARPGYTYDIKMSYDTDVYYAEIQEISPDRSQFRNLPLRELNYCKPENVVTLLSP